MTAKPIWFRAGTLRTRVPEAANDTSPWVEYEATRTCDCGCQRFFLFSLDGSTRAVCARCEMDHTEALR